MQTIIEQAPLDYLVIAPHPDDAELALGGTILSLKAQGARVGVLDLTDGEPTPHGSPEIRKRETAAASALLTLDWRGNLGLANRSSKDFACASVIYLDRGTLRRPLLVAAFVEFISRFRDGSVVQTSNTAETSVKIAARAGNVDGRCRSSSLGSVRPKPEASSTNFGSWCSREPSAVSPLSSQAMTPPSLRWLTKSAFAWRIDGSSNVQNVVPS